MSKLSKRGGIEKKKKIRFEKNFMETNSRNLLASFCSMLGKETLRLFLLLDPLGKQL